MKKIIYIFIFSVVILGLFSCTTVLHKGLWSLKKGSTSKEVKQIIVDNSGTSLIKIDHKDLFEIKTKTPYDGSYTMIVGKKVVNFGERYYLYAFKDDKLIFWGTPLEFARHENPLINELGDEGIKLIEKDM